MKKSFLAAIALTASSAFLAHSASAAEVRFVNADGNALSELCIAAVESETRFKALAKDLKLIAGEEAEVRCNGRSLKRFVSEMREKLDSKGSAEPAPVVFRAADASSPLSQLCMAVLESDEAYERVKASLRSELGFAESEVLCNGLPIKAFARKYRNMTAAL